jgi:hypothetical protein
MCCLMPILPTPFVRPGCATASPRSRSLSPPDVSPPNSSESMILSLSAVIGAVAKVGGPIALVASPARAVDTALRLNRDPPFAIYGSPAIAANDIIAIATDGVAAAVDELAQIETSRMRTLDMEAPAVAINQGMAVRSLLQTDTVATKVRLGSLATERTLPDDRNPLKADVVSRHPRADRMFVILRNRGVRPCQIPTILPNQPAARLGTRVS